MRLIDKIKKTAAQISGAAGVKVIANQFLAEYGEISDLKINKDNHSVTVSVLLNGDDTPITINIDEYEIVKTDQSVSIVVKAADSDKAWLNTAIKNFLIGKPYAVPANAVPFLDGIIG